MSNPGQRLLEAIAESVLDMTDEEVLEECRAAGQDPEVVADRMDAAARRAIDIHRDTLDPKRLNIRMDVQLAGRVEESK